MTEERESLLPPEGSMQPSCGETLPSGRAVALVAWCEANDFDPGDVRAPHVQAFLGGYDTGFEDGFEDGNEHATEYLRNGGTFR